MSESSPMNSSFHLAITWIKPIRAMSLIPFRSQERLNVDATDSAEEEFVL